MYKRSQGNPKLGWKTPGHFDLFSEVSGVAQQPGRGWGRCEVPPVTSCPAPGQQAHCHGGHGGPSVQGSLIFPGALCGFLENDCGYFILESKAKRPGVQWTVLGGYGLSISVSVTSAYLEVTVNTRVTPRRSHSHIHSHSHCRGPHKSPLRQVPRSHLETAALALSWKYFFCPV